MPDTLTHEDLAAIDARLAAATLGDWVDMGQTYPYEGHVVAVGDAGLTPICRDPVLDDRPEDRALIAHAPEDLRRLRGEVGRLKRDLTQGVARMQVRAEQAERERDQARALLRGLQHVVPLRFRDRVRAALGDQVLAAEDADGE